MADPKAPATEAEKKKAAEEEARKAAATTETTKASDLAEDKDGEPVDPSVMDFRDMVIDEGDNTPKAPAPREQTPLDAPDPMKRQPGAVPAGTAGTKPQKGEREYVITSQFWDGRSMHESGKVMRFLEGEQPRGAKLVE